MQQYFFNFSEDSYEKLIFWTIIGGLTLQVRLLITGYVCQQKILQFFGEFLSRNYIIDGRGRDYPPSSPP